MTYQEVVELLGSEAEKLLHHQAKKKILKSLSLHFKLLEWTAGSDGLAISKKTLGASIATADLERADICQYFR